MSVADSSVSNIFEKYESALLKDWVEGMLTYSVRRDVVNERELETQCGQFLRSLKVAVHDGIVQDIGTGRWEDCLQVLTTMSSARARQGFTPIETANFVFSLKQPLFKYLQADLSNDPATLVIALWEISTLLDKLGMFTIEAFQKTREQVIMRQQQELLELSTPVVQLWQNVLALPLIGTLDSARTQVVMENLLNKIIETGASIAIIDITGVPTVDTLVAQHLLKTVAAARLMGADCIISGIRPQIAQTIVHLGVNLEDVITKATLADAFVVALQRTGSTITAPAH
jgi:rsbT co-antagonist protein RsbR